MTAGCTEPEGFSDGVEVEKEREREIKNHLGVLARAAGYHLVRWGQEEIRSWFRTVSSEMPHNHPSEDRSKRLAIKFGVEKKSLRLETQNRLYSYDEERKMDSSRTIILSLFSHPVFLETVWLKEWWV